MLSLMSDNKNLELATSATSKIFEKVNTALGKNDSDKRWFWELLQNAKDTVVHSKGKVDVRVVISRNENDEPFVRFEHNGDYFKPSNHRFKFDDPKCLLLADSGKIEEDETQSEDITGQFGTGFLSTHILSLKILVEGIFLDRENLYNDFSFELDRNYVNKFDLAEKVEKSLNQYDNNFKPIQPPFAPFPTKFTYFLNDNKENLKNGIEVVKKGINDIDNFIPFVLAFCKEVNSVEIVDTLIERRSTCFSRYTDLVKQDKVVQIISINKVVRDDNNTILTDNHIEVALCSDLNNHIDIAIELEKIGQTYAIKPIGTELPVLFCTFPLIGSEKWRFPVMVNCTKFFPKPERDGILLLTGRDNGNQQLIEKSIECYETLLDFCIAENYQNLYWLAQTSYDVCPTEWSSEDWYKNVFKSIRKHLIDKKIVVQENENSILFKEALFPYHLGKEKLELLWDICNEFIGSFIPKKQDISFWKEIINADYPSWGIDLKYDIERLLKDIQSHGSLSQLAKNKFSENMSIAKLWLNRVFKFVLVDVEKPELFTKFKVIPNQEVEGVFVLLDANIHYDNGIPDRLKDLLDPFNKERWSFKKFLIADGIEGFEDHLPFTTKDISDHINKLLKVIIDNNFLKPETDKDGIHRGLFYQLVSCHPDNNFTDRKTLYEITIDLLPNEVPNELQILKNLDDFDFASCNEWIIRSLTEQISRVDKGMLQGLQNLNDIFRSKNPTEVIEWLDKFIVFVAGFEKKKHKELLEKYLIIPNQNEYFCTIDKLTKDDNIPLDLISIAECSQINHIWKNDLLHNEFKETKLLFDEYSTTNGDIIAAEINAAIRDYDGDKQNKKFAELIFLMNESESVNNSRYKKIFSDFHSNRDSLIVGTLSEGSTLSKIAKLIQNVEKLDILTELADNKNISNAQLEEFSNILTSENVSISVILDIAKRTSGQLSHGLISFEGHDASSDEEETLWKKIALFFLETLKDAGINDMNAYLQLLHKIKNNEILVRSDSFTSRFVPDEFDKVAYKAEITAIAIEKVISYLTNVLNYEIVEFDKDYPTIMEVRLKDKVFKIVIRPSNGERYQLHKKERDVLKEKDAELWLSNGIYVNREDFYSLSGRIFNSGTAFIPLEIFVPGRLLK